jgi:amidohydrolase
MSSIVIQPDIVQRIHETAHQLETEIRETLQWLYDHPELSGEEYQSSAYLADKLRCHGFTVEEGVAGLPTAFVARAPHSPSLHAPAVAFLAEYDALPQIGHGCGHNMIGTIGTYAGILLAKAFPQCPLPIRVYGTPAEETFGGKITMLEAGAFEGVGAAMMIHPGLQTEVAYTSLASIPMKVEFHGRTAHAAAAPHKGINALDAMILLFQSVALTQRQLPPGTRTPGIITHGGDAPNVIPHWTQARFSLRANTLEEAKFVRDKWLECVEAAAKATGCQFSVEPDGNPYADMRPDSQLAQAFEAAWTAFGDAPVESTPRGHGSLDIGNLSHHFPCLHPSIRITHDETIGGHTTEFRDATMTDYAHTQMMAGIKSLATTAYLCAQGSTTGPS